MTLEELKPFLTELRERNRKTYEENVTNDLVTWDQALEELKSLAWRAAGHSDPQVAIIGAILSNVLALLVMGHGEALMDVLKKVTVAAQQVNDDPDRAMWLGFHRQKKKPVFLGWYRHAEAEEQQRPRLLKAGQDYGVDPETLLRIDASKNTADQSVARVKRWLSEFDVIGAEAEEAIRELTVQMKGAAG